MSFGRAISRMINHKNRRFTVRFKKYCAAAQIKYYDEIEHLNMFVYSKIIEGYQLQVEDRKTGDIIYEGRNMDKWNQAFRRIADGS